MKLLKRIGLIILLLIILGTATLMALISIYKSKLSETVTEEVRVKYGADLRFEKVSISIFDNWPHASINLKNIELSTLSAKAGSLPLVKAKILALSFDVKELLQKNFVVRYLSFDGAELELLKFNDGSTNHQFSANDTISSGAKDQKVKFAIRKVQFKNCRFHLKNEQRLQNIAFKIKRLDCQVRKYDEGLSFKLLGDLFSEQLAFDEKKGAFAANKTVKLQGDLMWRRDLQTLFLLPSTQLQIDQQKYFVWLLYELKGKHQLAFYAKTKSVNYAEVTSVLTPKLRNVLNNFAVARPVDGSILLVTNTGMRQEPAIIVDFAGDGVSLTVGQSKIPYTHLKFKGHIESIDSTRQHGDMKNASLYFSEVSGNIYNFPFTAKISVKNFKNPLIAADAKLTIEAGAVDFKVAKDFLLQGTAIADINYSGPLAKLNAKEFLDPPMILKARVHFRNLSYREFNKTTKYVLNGDAMLNNKDLSFGNLRFSTLVGTAKLKGSANNFMSYLLGYSNGFGAKVVARTDLIDLNPLFKTNENTAKGNKKNKDDKSTTFDKKELNKFDFNIQLFAKKLLVRKVIAENLVAELSYDNNFIDVRNLKVNSCGGEVKASATLANFTELKATATTSNMDVKKMFEQFENFGQEAIVADNLQGRMFLEANLNTELDSKWEFIPGSLEGEVKLKLKDGHLINFEPLQKMSTLVFRNRDFNDITFTELSEVFHLKSSQLKIDELEVASSVLNFYVVDGVYSFSGISNINILLPWTNLRKRSKNYVPKSTGESAENTKGVKLNFRGPAKKMKVSFGHQPSPSF